MIDELIQLAKELRAATQRGEDLGLNEDEICFYDALADNVACLDFSVAKGGFLCAYRWNGEQKLSNENFVWV